MTNYEQLRHYVALENSINFIFRQMATRTIFLITIQLNRNFFKFAYRLRNSMASVSITHDNLEDNRETENRTLRMIEHRNDVSLYSEIDMHKQSSAYRIEFN